MAKNSSAKGVVKPRLLTQLYDIMRDSNLSKLIQPGLVL